MMLRHCCCVLALLAAPASYGADQYPNRPIRLVVPYAVGGATDITSRIISPRLSESMGEQVVVDNRPGGASIPGTALVAKAAPDGYTVLVATMSFGAAPALFEKLPFDARKDFAPVTLMTTLPMALTVHPSVPAKNVGELVALSKSRPNGLNYGSAGNGSATHLAGALFKTMSGANIVHVPYKGGGPSVAAMIAGEVQVMVAIVSTVLPHIKSGKLVALGVGTQKRQPVLPNVPTIAEQGIPGFQVFEWQGMTVPAGTPRAVIERLHREITKALAIPETHERITGLGADIVAAGPKELGALIDSEIPKWIKVAKETGIKAD
ncbi:MAG TPA: tripartite tricarboxylate transporter substrate binding protein [Burkholderiales bacterium]|nr:tripartite tricarboxylate transporter substrate binding protein [Burkholderiales bacterium]